MQTLHTRSYRICACLRQQQRVSVGKCSVPVTYHDNM